MTKQKIKLRLQDIIVGVYSARFDGDECGCIMHMGGAKEFQELMLAVGIAFPNLPRPHKQDWPSAVMPWNLDEWDTPETAAALILRELKQAASA